LEYMTEEQKKEFQEENEKKKEYLRLYRRAVRREKDILEEIQRLRLDKMFPSVVNDGMPHGSSQTDLSDYIAILDEQIELLKEERLEKARCYKRIEDRIRMMSNEDEQTVLRLRYIQGLKWEDVAAEMGYSWKQIHRIHSTALQNFKMT
jgi:DNA-directed RNA polymerase specialized sigma subunit